MTDADRLIKRYRAIAYGYGFKSEAADIAQEAFLGGLENPKWKQHPRHRVIDAIRKLYGRDVGHGYPDPLFNRLGGEGEERALLSAQKLCEEDGIDGHTLRKTVWRVIFAQNRVYVVA